MTNIYGLESLISLELVPLIYANKFKMRKSIPQVTFLFSQAARKRKPGNMATCSKRENSFGAFFPLWITFAGTSFPSPAKGSTTFGSETESQSTVSYQTVLHCDTEHCVMLNAPSILLQPFFAIFL